MQLRVRMQERYNTVKIMNVVHKYTHKYIIPAYLNSLYQLYQLI